MLGVQLCTLSPGSPWPSHAPFSVSRSVQMITSVGNGREDVKSGRMQSLGTGTGGTGRSQGSSCCDCFHRGCVGSPLPCAGPGVCVQIEEQSLFLLIWRGAARWWACPGKRRSQRLPWRLCIPETHQPTESPRCPPAPKSGQTRS